MNADEVRADQTGSNVLGKETVETWGYLEHEPCRFCRMPGGVFFLMNDGPEGRVGLQPMRCDNCKRTWISDSSYA